MDDRPVLVSARLGLRPIVVDDLDVVIAYTSDPDVARYQMWRAEDAADRAPGLVGGTWGAPGWCQLAIVERGSGAVVGDCGICFPAVRGEPAEVGITLSSTAQGQGYGTEVIGVLVRRLLVDGPPLVDVVVAHTDERNDAVHRVLERCGFRPRPGVVIEDDPHEGPIRICSYEATAADVGT